MDSDRRDQVPLETLTEWIWMNEIEFKNAFKHNSSRQFKCKHHSLLHWNIFFFFVKQAVLHYYYFFCSAQIALTSLSQLGTVLIRDTLPACREYITFLDILKANIYQTQLRCFIPHPALSIIKTINIEKIHIPQNKNISLASCCRSRQGLCVPLLYPATNLPTHINAHLLKWSFIKKN